MKSPVPFGLVTQYFDWHEAKTWSVNATDSHGGRTKGTSQILLTYFFGYKYEFTTTAEKEQLVYGLISCLVFR